MLKKLLTVSNILACVTFLFAFVTLILYAVNVNTAGFFQGVKVNGLVLLLIFTMVFDLLIIGRSFLNLEGIIDKVLDLVVMVLKVLAPLFVIIAVMSLVQTRIEGFGYIYFSNVDVAKEVATPTNLASAGVSITTIVFGALALLSGLVGAFISPKKD